jgi:hypothetical protein
MAPSELKPSVDIMGWFPFDGLRPDELNFASVDEALDRLRRPTLIEDRLRILQHVVNYWHGPILPEEDGMSDAELAGVPMPAALRWWYRWAGKRSEIMSGQNFLFVPRDTRPYGQQPHIVDDRLFFYVENQCVYQWSTLPYGDDPPVFGSYEGKGQWTQERVTLSEHLILTCMFEAIMCHAKYRASAAWLDEDRLDIIVQTIPALAIGPWQWVGTRFFTHRGAFMCAAENGQHEGKKWYSVWIGAKTEQPLQFLKPLLDDSWDYVAI